MYVYQVGEFCEYEGGGWSLIVADNENTFKNAVKVLVEHHAEKRERYAEILKQVELDGSDTEIWRDAVDEEDRVVESIRSCKSLDELNGLEIVGTTDVVSIWKTEVVE